MMHVINRKEVQRENLRIQNVKTEMASIIGINATNILLRRFYPDERFAKEENSDDDRKGR